MRLLLRDYLKQIHPAAAEDGKRHKTIPGTPLENETAG